ncbi:helix-turn-helix domain-containing protein [Paenibacillus chartarius]|uniref:Helix-turn-helix domain-containing protein n=1 Tax=Paenibacillus chartarius TaxID=747481 RepID=A0ABV6DPP0_9BACL
MQTCTDLAYCCKIIQESVGLPVTWRQLEPPGSTGPLEPPIPAGHVPVNPLFTTYAEQIRSVIGDWTGTGYPVLRSSPFMEQFIALPCLSDQRSKTLIIIGPAMLERPNDELIASLLNDHGIPGKDRPKWTAYLQSLPVVSRIRLLHIGALAHWLINKQPIDPMELLQYNFEYETPHPPSSDVDMALADRRETLTFHMRIESEKRMLSMIQSGNRAELLHILAGIEYEGLGVLSKRSQLRNMKNLSICCITLGTRAAIEGGLYEELAYTLSDLHIQHIEELTDVKSVEAAMNYALLDFAGRVAQLSNTNDITAPVRICREYIYDHLYEEMSAGQLADLAGLNANYLSKLFKQQTGLSLMNFIQKERIEEAKKLLVQTRDSVAAIGSRLCFYDQTYFIKVFKKYTGITPREYRNRK